MSNDNGNGEVKKLVALRQSYRGDVTQLEADLRVKFGQELDGGKKDLKEKYLEKVVDWFYSNGFNGNGQPPAPPEPAPAPGIEVTPTPAPAVSVTVNPSTQTSVNDLQPTGSGEPVLYCNECGSEVAPSDQYCSQCASPLRTPKLTVAGHMHPLSADRERMVRIARQTANAQAPEDRRMNDWARTRRR